MHQKGLSVLNNMDYCLGEVNGNEKLWFFYVAKETCQIILHVFKAIMLLRFTKAVP